MATYPTSSQEANALMTSLFTHGHPFQARASRRPRTLSLILALFPTVIEECDSRARFPRACFQEGIASWVTTLRPQRFCNEPSQAPSFRGVSPRYSECRSNRRQSDRVSLIEKGNAQTLRSGPLPAIYRGWTSIGSGKLTEPCIWGPIVTFCPRGV